MHLVRLIYVSTLENAPDLNIISRAASTNNAKNGLSGLLVFDSHYFLQVVEGGRAAVSQLLRNLFHDTRHKKLIVLGFDYIAEREFGEWSMQFVPLTGEVKQILFRHGIDEAFNPYRLDKEMALSFMQEMRDFVGA
jgi:hypothetical protein